MIFAVGYPPFSHREGDSFFLGAMRVVFSNGRTSAQSSILGKKDEKRQKVEKIRNKCTEIGKNYWAKS
ncbi:MAG: hypothetical protein HFJ86_12775 [Oscillospiraceae bacterium]|jgi:hypothetical protein|nr:hypothetical protein [Oscillospiraceae bacterium]